MLRNFAYMSFAVWLALVCGAPINAADSGTFDVKNFGAKGDGTTLNTASFRAASQAASVGGGVIFVPAGVFLTGAFNLTSGVTLHVEKDAVVLGATSTLEYPVVAPLPSYGVSRDVGYLRYQALVFATGSDVRIIGNGTIDGNGKYWWDLHHAKQLSIGRPRLVELYNCSRVEVGGVTLKNSGFWTLHPVYSSYVWIHDVTITAPADSPNTDGIDPDSSQNVLIERCDISCGDDHIAIKSGLDAAGRRIGIPARNITVTGNVHRAGRGVSIGSEVSGGVEDVFVHGVTHLGPSEHGLHIKTSKERGGYVRNIWFTNISIGEVVGDSLLGILTSYGGSHSSSTSLTDIRDIHFVGINRTAGAPEASHGPGSFDCFSDSVPCHNLTLTDVTLMPARGEWSCKHVSDSSHSVNHVSPPGLSSCLGAQRIAPAEIV